MRRLITFRGQCSLFQKPWLVNICAAPDGSGLADAMTVRHP